MERAEGRKIPRRLQEAYDLRDASDSPEEREFYQEYVYRLRAKEYRARGIHTGLSVRRREAGRAEARLQARARTPGSEEEEPRRLPWWKRIFERKERGTL